MAPERVDVEKRLIQFWNPLLMALLIGTFAPPICDLCGRGKLFCIPFECRNGDNQKKIDFKEFIIFRENASEPEKKSSFSPVERNNSCLTVLRLRSMSPIDSSLTISSKPYLHWEPPLPLSSTVSRGHPNRQEYLGGCKHPIFKEVGEPKANWGKCQPPSTHDDQWWLTMTNEHDQGGRQEFYFGGAIFSNDDVIDDVI